MVSRFVATLLATSTFCMPVAAEAQSADTSSDRQFNIPAQSLAKAITSFGQQAGRQIFFPSRSIRNRQSRRVVGRMSSRSALDQLLDGSGLTVRSDDGRTIVLADVPAQSMVAQKSFDRPLSTDVADDKTSSTNPDIIVTGQKAQDRNAIAAKREEARIVDVISADDVGKMTDFNAGEAIRRIAGVNTWSYLGEPRFVTIRGFNASYNSTTVDGFQLATPDNSNYGSGRQFYMDALPSNIASKIEVFKTWTPDMEGHGIGGTINFAVPDALALKRNRFDISVRGGASLNKDAYGPDRPTYQAEAMFARKFGARDQFGLVLIGSYWRRQMNIAQYEIGSDAYSFGPAKKSGGLAVVLNPYGGTYGYYPAQLTQHNYDDDRNRKSLFGKFSWAPASGQKLFIDGFYLEQNEIFLRNSHYVDTAQNSSNFDGRNFRDGYAEIDNSSSQYERVESGYTRKIYGGNATYIGKITSDLTYTAKAGYSEATFKNPQTFTRFALPGANNEYWAVQRDGEYFTWTPIGQAFADKVNNLSLYATNNGGGGSGAAAGRFHQEEFGTVATLFQAETNLAYNMERSDRGIGFEIGGELTDNGRRDTYVRNDYGSATQGVTLSNVFSGNYICVPGCSGAGIAIIDGDKLKGAMTNLPVAPNPTQAGNRFTTNETVTAAYLLARYKLDRFQLLGGVRYEATDYFTSGFQQNVPKSGGNGTYDPVSATDHFDNWLPSISAIYDATPTIRFRAAYSRTLGRPSLVQKSLRSGTLDLTADPAVLSKGNPSLRPRLSDNFDAIGEWYFDRGNGMLSLGVFYKAVQNEIFRQQSLRNIDGLDYLLTTPVNSPFTTKVKGIEGSLVKNLTFLPGPLSNLGVSANGVWLNTKFPILSGSGAVLMLDTMPDQAKYATNLQVFYEDHRGFSARVAWNHVGWAWDGRISGTTNLPGADLTAANALYRVAYNTPRNSLDIRVSQNFGKLSLSASAVNLLHQGQDFNIGTNQEIAAKRLYVPTNVMVGASYHF